MTQKADITATPARPGRRADAGTVRFSQRDIDGLLLCGEHYGAPYDLLAAALRVSPERLPAIVARWRRAGYAATGRFGPGPAWCWLTRDGMAATGLGLPATRPAPGPPAGGGGIPSGGCPRPARRTASGTWPTRRSTGPASTTARTPGRSGRSRSS